MSDKKVEAIGHRLGVNFDVVPLPIWVQAVNIETEHRDLIGGSLIKAAKIALAHLQEFPDYYQRLIRMEKAAERYWKGKDKPTVVL